MTFALTRKTLGSTYVRSAIRPNRCISVPVQTASRFSSTASGNDSPLTPDKSHNIFTRKASPYKLGKHRSNALELLEKHPVIEVDGDTAVCDGGGGALGHPLEYIKLGDRADYDQGHAGVKSIEDGVPCIYCGLRYRKRLGSGGH
mmetsp:Transcript_18836/g.27759  ORF Transcript_18836/g.27759 Transcript_18836/m.27759 type:complete len:145 (-) Transcript_18836:66-500(-)|eukprot:CAMPEP_0194085326 /NCGR_PEP_ID=MMETSP0149-20130528/17212_1 /TAXON_ID=122233 /ORGANISM="Chaetoceros debilis, Strain MM31A-1" /LENGTH=144 /DNA_ID=CAMNT_0038768193 /DNA_START=53 /DNA_END=487 /DNA_ORIENTATION=-